MTLITMEGLARGSLEEFLSSRDGTALTAAGGAACFVLALKEFVRIPDLGALYLAAMTDISRLEETEGGYRGLKLRNQDLRLISMQLADNPWLPDSYICGTSPETGYTLPESGEYTMDVKADPRSSGTASVGTAKVFVACTGADSPRPVTLKRNGNGIWKALEWSSLLVGIRPPATPEGDDI